MSRHMRKISISVCFAMLVTSIMLLCLGGAAFNAATAESVLTRDSLPNEVAYADYAAEFGAQGEKGWTYWYKKKDAESWTKFESADYDAVNKLYQKDGTNLGHLGMVPSGGTLLKREYTMDRDAVVRFMLVLHAYNSDGNDVTVDANFDGQRFYMQIDGEKQMLNYAKIGVAANDNELEAALTACELTASDYAEAEFVEMKNNDKGVYLVFADVKLTKDTPIELILDTDGNGDGFKGEWCDGAGFRVKPIISYYKGENNKVLPNGDVLDETTMPGDFGPMGYFVNPTWNGTDNGMPFPNPYIDQFGEQGKGGWYYKMQDPDLGIIDMVYDSEKGKYLAPAGNPGAGDDVQYISNNSSVANYGRPIIKAFKADKSGIVRFVGQVRNGYFMEAEDMDGQKFYVKDNDGNKIPFKYGKTAHAFDATNIEDPSATTYIDAVDNELFLPADNGDGYRFDDVYYVIVETAVERGEFVYFYGDAVGQPWCDKMNMGIVPIYTYVDPSDAISNEDFTPKTVFSELYDLGYGNEQNTNSWYYMFGNANGDYYKSIMDAGVWTSGFGTISSSKSMTPANDYDAIRVWRAAESGTVRILGLAQKVAEGGDGAILTIFKRSGGVDSELYNAAFVAGDLLEKEIMIGAPRDSESYVNVNAGDLIFFTLSAGETSQSDEINTKFYVVYIESDGDSSELGVGDVLPPYTVSTVLDSQYAMSSATSQGANGWYKFFGSVEEYYKMKYSGEKWITGYEGSITANRYIPSKKYSTINAYRAPSSGSLDLFGIIKKQAAGGNGLSVVITHISNTVGVVKETIDIGADDLAAKNIDMTLEVVAGDFIFFEVKANKTVDNDEIVMKLFVQYTVITETPQLGNELGDSAPPVKTVDEYTIDDISQDMYHAYMSANYAAQGTNGWYYLYGKGDTYYEMKKDGNNWRGPGNDPYNMIEGPRGTTPGGIWDTIRAYQVPNDGYMRVFGHFDFWQGSGGDGIKVTIKNMTSGDVIYNEIFKGGSEWQRIHTVATNEFKVERGDVLFFIINKGGENNEYDNVTVGLYPLYSVKLSNETDCPTGGIGALEFSDSAVPPEDESGEGENNSHIVQIPLPNEQPIQNDKMPIWVIILICVGGVVIVGGIAAAIVVIKRRKV